MQKPIIAITAACILKHSRYSAKPTQRKNPLPSPQRAFYLVPHSLQIFRIRIIRLVCFKPFFEPLVRRLSLS